MAVRKSEAAEAERTAALVALAARAVARVHYPQMSEAELDGPAKRWNGAALVDADCTVWQDFSEEAAAVVLALRTAGYLR